MKTISFGLAVLAAMVISGCATTPIENLPDNVKLSAPGRMGQQTVEVITFEREGPAKQNLATCAAMNIENNSVTLSNDTSFVGAFTGNYYHGRSEKVVGGGSTLQAQDGETGVVVASGAEEYSKSGLIPIASVVRFKALLAPLEDRTVVQFKNIEVAQKSTGSIPNSGFSPLGSWTGSYTMDAYGAMERVAESILDCAHGASIVD